jgi:hypothetical protein
MPIPGFQGDTGNLPPGIHDATLEEIRRRFATNRRRKEVFRGLEFAVSELDNRGVTDIWIDGSFVTAKERPRDVDMIFLRPFDYGPTWGILYIAERENFKLSHRVDLLPENSIGPDAVTGLPIPIIDFFQQDRNGQPKGLIRLRSIGGATK